MSFIPADQLQKALRGFGGGLSNVEVTPKSEALMPGIVDIIGTCWIMGAPFTYHVEDFDLRRIKDADSIMGLAQQLLESFQEAEKRSAKGDKITLPTH
jgi:hypothetical protein